MNFLTVNSPNCPFPAFASTRNPGQHIEWNLPNGIRVSCIKNRIETLEVCVFDTKGNNRESWDVESDRIAAFLVHAASGTDADEIVETWTNS